MIYIYIYIKTFVILIYIYTYTLLQFISVSHLQKTARYEYFLLKNSYYARAIAASPDRQE